VARDIQTRRVASGDSTRQTALITGASVGIGRDLARVFAEHGHDLVVTARNQSQLESLAAELNQKHGITVDVIAKDLSLPAAPRELFDETRSRGIAIEMLVNDAGFGTSGPFDRTDLESILNMLRVNVVALTHLARLFLPEMLARGRGRILNVASTAAFQPGPLMAVYYASKAYVLSLSEAIAAEVESKGVSVTALCPGPTATEFQKRAGIENSRLFQRNTMDSLTVARAGYAGMMRGKRVVIPGLNNRALALAAKLSPRRLTTAVAKKLNQTRV
jgi:short-subunit dehydrogenase